MTLTRQFELASPGEIRLSFGFSDEITLQVDDETVFEGRHTFANMGTYESRGYVRPDQHTLTRSLTARAHTLTATLKAVEPFGWGLIALLQGESVRLLPVN